MANNVAFKGTINGIILQFDPLMPFDELYQAFKQKLNEANRFFEGSHIIGIEQGTFTDQQEQELSRLFQKLGGMKVLSLENVDCIKRERSDTSQKKIPETLSKPVIDAVAKIDTTTVVDTTTSQALPKLEPHEKVIMHKGTLRSGRRLVSDGHIVLLGDANPGSELVAKGNIIVLGALRGIAHAGSAGDESAYILATKLQPTQLRIASNITRPPDGDADGRRYTEIVTVKDKQFVIKPY